MDTYVVDTHSLIWFITENHMLSKRASQILEEAEKAEVEVLIPTIILAEIIYIAVVPFDFPIFQIVLKLPEDWEIHDRIIAATARYYGAQLITKDETLRKFTKIETVW